MDNAFDRLESFRARISTIDLSDVSTVPRLAVSRAGGVCRIDFYGDPGEAPYMELIETLARRDVAPYIASIRMRAPDVGANGTQNWNLEPLLATGAAFDSLAVFEIELNGVGEHNRRVVADIYEENGVLGQLLARSPEMRELTVPSAPDASFFEAGERPLRHLSVDAGFDHQGFLGRLASSDCFPNLRAFEWGEFAERYMEDFAERCVPEAIYAALFESPVFQQLDRFVLRNPQLTFEKLRELRKAAPSVRCFEVTTNCF